VCCSTIQLYFVVNLCSTKYKNDIVDVIITDDLKNSHTIVENANKNHIFNEAVEVRCSKSSMEERTASGLNRLNKLFNHKHDASNFYEPKKVYDCLLLNSISSFTQGLYEILYENNKNIKVLFIEDGFSTYCFQGTELLKNITRNSVWYRKAIYKVMGIRLLVNNIDAQLMYEPENALWEAPFPRIKVDKIDVNNKEIQKQLSLMFNYESMTDVFDRAVIFFEESYRAEGIEINDVELVEKIASWIGKENIMIKIHPRNKKNVFRELGYKTNENTEIPWEVIFMNNGELKDKLLVSIASGCIVTPYTLFNADYTAVSLMNMPNINPSGFLPEYYDYFRKQIYSKNPDIFKQPYSEAELKQIILNFMGGKHNEDRCIDSD
jgi:hypothetical protein